MLVTVGLIKELQWVSKNLKTPIAITIGSSVTKYSLNIMVTDGILDINYNDHHIWHEKITGASEMFNIESCQNISTIIMLLDAGDTKEWLKFRYLENT